MHPDCRNNSRSDILPCTQPCSQREGYDFPLGLGLSRASIRFSNSGDLAISRAAYSINSVAVSRNFSASRRSCSEIVGSGTRPFCHNTKRNLTTIGRLSNSWPCDSGLT